MKTDLIQRRLRVFLNFQHFPVKQRNWGIKEDWVKHHLEIFLMLLYFTGFRYCCLRNSESSRNPVKYILAPVLKWSFGSWQIKRNSKLLFSSNAFYVTTEYSARKKNCGFPKLVFDVSTCCWYQLFCCPGLLEVLRRNSKGLHTCPIREHKALMY